ncbi:MBL fold metallo-hydrolase [Kitasatospora sp. RB6PN24]|uniref:MBL fold metallo-hydrolase n=1 Tax=Kitasatospora humi TaxID=2893891 RepID=UPI001E51F563|nr:MBL fold metallo-hydrolase [Kitasatospora humi]MCC9307769.1 MBL fold metallo-hydrolase [Kitasatospora humi]
MNTVPPPHQARILFVGTATLLIRYGDLTVLTDPNFLHRGQYAYLGHGLVSRRRTEPALQPADLPEDLDAVVLSHLHGDHFDRRARAALDHDTPIVTTPHAARRLRGLHRFRNTVALRTWQQHTLQRADSRLRVTALPARHAGSAAVRALLPPVMGSMLEFGEPEGPPRLRIYLSGDTLVHDALREIPRRYPDPDLAVLHLGGTRIAGLLLTMDGDQGAEAVLLLNPRRVLPIHNDDYSVFRSPLTDFLTAARARRLDDRIVHCAPGQTVTIGPTVAGVGEPPAPGQPA